MAQWTQRDAEGEIGGKGDLLNFSSSAAPSATASQPSSTAGAQPTPKAVTAVPDSPKPTAPKGGFQARPRVYLCEFPAPEEERHGGDLVMKAVNVYRYVPIRKGYGEWNLLGKMSHQQ